MRRTALTLCLALAAASPVRSEAPPPGEQPPGSPAASSPVEAELRNLIRAAAAENGIPSEVAEAVAEVESGYDPKAVGGVGEIGLMQVLPSTARMLGFRAPLPELFDPATNIRYGVRYLGEAWRKTGRDICGTVMKYRAGHGETRFSQRSVAYCVRVRSILAARGFRVTGEVPVATFGAPAGAASGVSGARRLANGRVRMKFNWAVVDNRRRALSKQGAPNVLIAQ